MGDWKELQGLDGGMRLVGTTVVTGWDVQASVLKG